MYATRGGVFTALFNLSEIVRMEECFLRMFLMEGDLGGKLLLMGPARGAF